MRVWVLGIGVRRWEVSGEVAQPLPRITFFLFWGLGDAYFGAFASRFDEHTTEDKTAELSQRRPRDAPNIWVP